MADPPPPWPMPDVRCVARHPVFLLVTCWERATYPARLQHWRDQWQPRVWKDVETQRYVEGFARIAVAAWRHALQGTE